MDAGNWAAIIVAAIALMSAILTGRVAAGASKYSTKAMAETEAYNRARKMDVETIGRQDQEIEELRQQIKEQREEIAVLKADNKELHDENDRLRRRIVRLEKQKHLGDTNG